MRQDSQPMTVAAALETRQSVRKFLDRPVPADVVRDILRLSANAPSGSNLQPWSVQALANVPLQHLGEAIKAAYLADEPGHQREYEYYTDPVFEPYLARRRACGWGLYGTLGIARDEKARMKAQRATNYDFFGAPVGLVCSIDRRLEIGSWLDLGGFIQSVLLAAPGHGLHTCAQAAIAEYPKIVRAHLPIPGDHLVVCGIALGYADFDARVNQFRTTRCAVEEFATFHGFEA